MRVARSAAPEYSERQVLNREVRLGRDGNEGLHCDISYHGFPTRASDPHGLETRGTEAVHLRPHRLVVMSNRMMQPRRELDRHVGVAAGRDRKRHLLRRRKRLRLDAAGAEFETKSFLQEPDLSAYRRSVARTAGRLHKC